MRRPSDGLPIARRMGTLLLVVGGILLAVPLGLVAYDEITYRVQMARVPTPSPVMLSPADSASQPPGQLPGQPSGQTPGPAPASPDGGADALGGAGHTAPADSPAGSPGSVARVAGPPGPAGRAASGDPAGNAGHPGGAGHFGAGDASNGPKATYQISIPRIGVNYVVGEGVDNPVLDLGPGHYPQTVLPGEKGNAALAGHRTIRGRPAYFYDLDKLQAGDEIHIAYPDRTLVFAVERVFLTSPYDLSVLSPTEHAALTLTTCDPPGSDEMRLIVQSRLVREVQT